MDEPPLIKSIAASQDGVVTKAQAIGAGLARHEVDTLCRSGRWRRLARGVYLVDADLVDVVPRRARIRAAVISLGLKAVAVLDTAAELHGVAGLRRTDEIHVSLPGEAAKAQHDRDPTVVIHQLTIPRQRLMTVGGIPVSDAVQTVGDVILRADRYTAVSVLDSALNRDVLPADELVTIPALIRGRRGAVAARRYLGEADARAQSPLETRARLRCVDGHVPPDVLQVPVRDRDGYLLGIGDLGWLGAQVIGEADGAGPHGTPAAVYEDRRRQNRIANAGWMILRFTWADTLRPDYIPYVVRSALATRLRR